MEKETKPAPDAAAAALRCARASLLVASLRRPHAPTQDRRRTSSSAGSVELAQLRYEGLRLLRDAEIAAAQREAAARAREAGSELLLLSVACPVVLLLLLLLLLLLAVV